MSRATLPHRDSPRPFSRELPTLLIADDEANLRRVMRALLERDGFDVLTAKDGEDAFEMLEGNHIDVLVTDLRMPKMDGMMLLKKVIAKWPQLPVVMITAHGTVDTAVEALKLGAFDYVTKPFDRNELRSVVRKAAKTRALSRDDIPVEPGHIRLIGESPAMQAVYEMVERVAPSPSTVMIRGESGTGKELIAVALHEKSGRRDKPFVRVNCAAIPEELIESELFGHERGAFTGAINSKPGRFELADGGTLFLDEIGEVPRSMQAKLLRAIQEQSFERVGGIKTLQVDVRLIAATNRDLEAAIASGDFREDLYYRLNVVDIHLPPLRQRTGDIPLLLKHFLARFNESLGRTVHGFSEGALEVLMAYGWRGNIRELENLVERAMLFCDGDEIGIEHLPPHVHESEPQAEGELGLSVEGGLKDAVRRRTLMLERALIQRALEQTDGNVTHAARILKISRKSLQTKMKDLGLR